MDFISTYGLFLAKAVTLVVAVAAIVMIIMNAALRKRAQNGQLRLTHLGDDYQQMKEDLQLAKMKPQAQKVWLKNHKKSEKLKAKAEKQAARDAENEAKRAAMLEDRLRKGGRLSKRQQEWLDAFRAIQGAQAQLQPLRDQIKVAEDNLAQLQQTNRTLAEIQKGLDKNHAALNALIKLG